MTTQQVYLVRHGETEWSLSGQHTGTTDIPLTNGRKLAKRLEPVLASETFALILTSPLERARKTCELAGLGARAQGIIPELESEAEPILNHHSPSNNLIRRYRAMKDGA